MRALAHLPVHTGPELFVPQCVFIDAVIGVCILILPLSLVINECALLQILKSVFGIHQNFHSVAFI